MANFTHETFIQHDDYMTPPSAWDNIKLKTTTTNANAKMNTIPFRVNFNRMHPFSEMDKLNIMEALERYYATNEKFNCMMTTMYDTIIVVKNTHACLEGYLHFNINLSTTKADGSYTKSDTIHCYWNTKTDKPTIFRMTMMVTI